MFPVIHSVFQRTKFRSVRKSCFSSSRRCARLRRSSSHCGILTMTLSSHAGRRIPSTPAATGRHQPGDHRLVQRKQGLRAARISLACATTDQLPVDAGTGIVLAADDMQSAERGDAGAECDIGPAAGHVGRDRDLPGLPGRGNDLRFFVILSRVEHAVGQAGCGEQRRQPFRFRHRIRADQDRPAFPSDFVRLVDHRSLLCLSVPIEPRRQHLAAARAVQGNLDDAQTVDRGEFGTRLAQGAAHSTQAEIALEEALVSDLSGGGRFVSGFAAFLELDHLMQAARPDASRRDAPGGFIDDAHLAVAHQVVAVTLIKVHGGERGTDGFLAVQPVVPDCAERARRPFERKHGRVRSTRLTCAAGLA